MAIRKHYKPREPRTRVNHMIRVPEVRVINSDGEQLGVMPTDQAIEIADEQGLDLVEVSPTAAPPVCRITDYGKFKYEKAKRSKQSKKKQHTIQIKEIKLRPKTEEHDYQFKKRHGEEFLEKGFKVKFTMIFRGRELDHKEMGARMLKRMANDLTHIGVIERPAMFEGRLMTMFMAPLPTAQHQQQKKQQSDTKKEGKAKPAAANEETEKEDEVKPAAANEETEKEDEVKPAAANEEAEKEDEAKTATAKEEKDAET